MSISRRRKFHFILLAVITTLFVGFLRFYKLGSIPQGLTKDESYYGYDAYSVLKTGKDIWGNKLPLSFKSTGEYKMNLTYFIVPFVKLFGLNEMSVRLPSAVFGFATLFVLFLTLNKLLSHRFLSLLLTAIYALSPFSFGMSRLFYESNVGLFFISLGIFFIISNKLMPAAIFLGLSSYLYNPYRYIGIGLLLGAIFIHYLLKQSGKKQTIRSLLSPVIIYILILAPLVIFSAKGTSLNRLEEELILQKTNYEMKINDMRANCYLLTKSPSLSKLCYPLWNKVILHTANVASSFIKPLSPDILFIDNANEYIIPQNYGIYFSFLLPFYFLGLVWLFGFTSLPHLGKYERYFILLGLIISSGIVAITGNIEIYRYSALMYFDYLLIGFGVLIAIKLISPANKTLVYSIYLFFTLLAGFQISKYLVTYNLFTYKLPLLFASDDREIYEYLETKQDYQYIVDKKFHGPITASFFWAIDPVYYQQNIVWTDPDPWGFINAYRLGNIYSQTYSVEQLLCLKHKNPTEPIKAIVIDDPGKYNAGAVLLTHDFSGSLTLHAVFDIDTLYPYVKEFYPADLCSL